MLDMVRDAVTASHAREMVDRYGGVFIRNTRLMDEDGKILIHSIARIVISDEDGPVSNQIKLDVDMKMLDAVSKTSVPYNRVDCNTRCMTNKQDKINELLYYNELGGFSKDGREYVIQLDDKTHTPAPWINVIANKHFGFHVSETGSGYVWSGNSRENKLTPWSNDPVTDPPGEVIYIKDDNSSYWTLTPRPVSGGSPYTIRHGHGYSSFQHESHGINQKLTVFAAADEAIKLSLVELENVSGYSGSYTLTYYMRPVLGVNEHITSQNLITHKPDADGPFMITNSYNTEFRESIAFIGSSEKIISYTGDRDEFIGMFNGLDEPGGLFADKLSGRTGAGYDPCAVIQIRITLSNGEKKAVVFQLGKGKNIDEVKILYNKYKDIRAVINELDSVRGYWRQLTDKIQVVTPDTSMNLLLNGWLIYQIISCRVWARSAFYQSGGAFGFRDQLQDVMAAAYSWPELVRNQILLHSKHQFPEGDVQHWWHNETGKGIRTRYSDDLLWLPYVTADYIERTGDWSILDEHTGYVESEPLGEEDERYEVPAASSYETSLYEHCIRAIDRSLKFGDHGIPLMGSGDWNDGMNTVGNKGKGESIWLGWFMYKVLMKFIPISEKYGDMERAIKYGEIGQSIAEAIEKNAWDGNWYLRAYFDDGTPLGSARNTECRIDSISQSWSVISGAAKESRAKEAMRSVEQYLVDTDEGLIKLLTPPFDTGDLYPGYIKGYVPGVRENGGQYTHAAVWTVMAYAGLGMGDMAWKLFNMINPVNHTRTPIEYNIYKLEPYVMAADVYSVPPHEGRGGWSWYTGAAGWMYRVGIEHILGIIKNSEYISFNPCIPREWEGYSVNIKLNNTIYNIEIKNPYRSGHGVKAVVLDGAELEANMLKLSDDGKCHKVEVILDKLSHIDGC